MTAAYILGGFIDFGIMIYTYYFLTTVRFYHCVNQKMGEKIHLWSWIVALCGMISGFMPYYSFRAIFMGFDCTTKVATIFQLLVWLYGFTLFIFHIKTTSNEKVV
jgi:hypothetical protein